MLTKMLVYKRRDEDGKWWWHLNPTFATAHNSRVRWEDEGQASPIEEVLLNIDDRNPRIMGADQYARCLPKMEKAA